MNGTKKNGPSSKGPLKDSRMAAQSAGGRLVGCRFGDIHPAAIAVEVDVAVDQCKNGVIAADSDIAPGMPLGATLADDDISGNDRFAAEFLNAQPLAS